MSEGLVSDDAKELERSIRSYDLAIEALEIERQRVLSGEHPEYKRRCRRLQQAKEESERNARDCLEAELKTLEKLHELEYEAAEKQMERGMELAREKVLDQLAARAKSLEARRQGKEDDAAARMNTRSLRSKITGDDGERSTTRRTTGTRRGAQSPTAMLLDKAISDQDIDSDFRAISQAQQLSPSKRARTTK